MAYDTNEERLLVKGSEQITRDLKVNRDAYIGETLDTKNLIIEDDLNVKGEAIFDDDVAIHGDLYVEGTTTTTSEAQVSSSGNYIVTRDNNATPLATGEYSGLAVNNYASGKIATITADKDGTWRISDSATASATTYTDISAYNGAYYTGLSQTTTTGPSGILTNVDADELASVVLNGSSYYHKAGNDWFGPVTLVSNALDMGSIVTDATLIATLNGLTKHDLVYYRSATDKSIDASTNQPLLTREEASNLTGGQALTWDATNERAVGKTIDTTVTANSNNLITSGAVKTAVDNAVDALDVASVGGDGCYISAISETDGKISATATTMDTAPTANSTKAVTSGGVKTAIDNEATARDTAITNAINALDVSSVGGDGCYISAISETDGKISATATTMDTAPTASSTKAVTSGGIQSAISTAESNAKNLANATGTLGIAHGGTGATTAANARTCLGLGNIATINKNSCTTQFLRGDGTWATPPSGSGTVTSVNVSVNGCTGTAVTTSGTVTLTNVPTCKVYKTMATANADRQLLLGEASESAGYGCVYVGNCCKATFNPGTGALKVNTVVTDTIYNYCSVNIYAYCASAVTTAKLYSYTGNNTANTIICACSTKTANSSLVSSVCDRCSCIGIMQCSTAACSCIDMTVNGTTQLVLSNSGVTAGVISARQLQLTGGTASDDPAVKASCYFGYPSCVFPVTQLEGLTKAKYFCCSTSDTKAHQLGSWGSGCTYVLCNSCFTDTMIPLGSWAPNYTDAYNMWCKGCSTDMYGQSGIVRGYRGITSNCRAYMCNLTSRDLVVWTHYYNYAVCKCSYCQSLPKNSRIEICCIGAMQVVEVLLPYDSFCNWAIKNGGEVTFSYR